MEMAGAVTGHDKVETMPIDQWFGQLSSGWR
jgi:hypothetical protein